MYKGVSLLINKNGKRLTMEQIREIVIAEVWLDLSGAWQIPTNNIQYITITMVIRHAILCKLYLLSWSPDYGLRIPQKDLARV